MGHHFESDKEFTDNSYFQALQAPSAHHSFGIGLKGLFVGELDIHGGVRELVHDGLALL